MPLPEQSIKITRRIDDACFCAAAGLCLLAAVMALLNTFALGGVFGLRFFAEQTDAMRPAVPRGALLITVNRKPEQIKQGDIIAYEALPKQPASRMARVVAERMEVNGNVRFRTTRPGSEQPDSILINATSVLGVKWAVIPRAGYLVLFMRAHAGLLAALSAALCAGAGWFRRRRGLPG